MTLLDVSDLHLSNLTFQVLRDDGRHVDFSDLVTQVSWSDHVNTAAMEVSITAVGDPREVLKIGMEGTTATVRGTVPNLTTGRLGREELWRGFFEEVLDDRTSEGLERQITAYDPGKLLATHEEDYVFKNQTLDQIVRRIGTDLEIPIGSIPSTGRKLGNIICRGESMWDIFQKAVQKHYNLTGEAWRIRFLKGRMYLDRQMQGSKFWVFEVGRSLQQTRRTRSIADLENRVKLYGNVEAELGASKLEATVENTRSQRIYGLRQRVEYVSDEDLAKVRAVAKQRIDANSIPHEEIEVTGWAVPLLRAGDRTRLIDPEIGVEGMYYVQSLECTFMSDGAETIATCVKEPITPELFLDELVVA